MESYLTFVFVIFEFLFLESALIGNALCKRTKILASLVAQFGGELKNCESLYLFLIFFFLIFLLDDSRKLLVRSLTRIYESYISYMYDV